MILKRTKTILTGAGVVFCGLTSLAVADEILNKNMVCALSQVVGCVESNNCIDGLAKEFELPSLVTIDAQKKQLKSAFETGKAAYTSIENVKESDGHIVLQGAENGVGWTMSVNKETGKMQGSGVGNELSFLVFGSCTSL